MQQTIVLLLPLAGTALGAAMVLFMRNTIGVKLEKSLLGFASGVMIAASVWSLLLPSIDMAQEQGTITWVPAAVGFLLGILFLLALDCLVPHIHPDSGKAEGVKKTALPRTTMMLLAVTLHNIPEGMAVGVALAGARMGDAGITMAGAIALSLGIAIQNFPEGGIVSMPLRSSGMKKGKACFFGILSGAVEPVAAFITVLLAELVTPVLPYLLSFAAGAMMYVVIDELIPEAQNGEHSNLAIVATALGFTLMMVLDVALG